MSPIFFFLPAAATRCWSTGCMPSAFVYCCVNFFNTDCHCWQSSIDSSWVCDLETSFRASGFTACSGQWYYAEALHMSLDCCVECPGRGCSLLTFRWCTREIISGIGKRLHVHKHFNIDWGRFPDVIFGSSLSLSYHNTCELLKKWLRYAFVIIQLARSTYLGRAVRVTYHHLIFLDASPTPSLLLFVSQRIQNDDRKRFTPPF